MLFSILHSSRGRPDKCFEIIKHTLSAAKFRNSAEKEVNEYLLVLDKEDPKLDEYQANWRSFNKSIYDNLTPYILEDENFAFVAKNNFAAGRSVGEILLIVADDFYFPQGWDEIIVNKLNSLYGENGWQGTEWVIWLNDGDDRWWNKDHYPNGYLTMPIVSKAYYKRKGHLFFPEFIHYYSDPDFYEQCLKDGIPIINMKNELKCIHKHYANPNGNAKDDTYTRVENWAARDREIFKKRWGF